MKSAIHTMRRMSLRDWVGIGQAYYFLARAGWMMFVRKQRLDRWIGTKPSDFSSGHLSEHGLPIERRRAWWIEVAAARPRPWAMCLQRSLALCLWMQQQGYDPKIRIGVRRDNPSLDAHAWVEYAGVILNDDPNLGQLYAAMRSRNNA